MDPSKILYYLNQGGPGIWTIVLFAVYKGYQVVTQLLTELKEQNTLMLASNTLMKELIDKSK